MVKLHFLTCLYLFKEVFQKKLSSIAFFFVNSPQNKGICIIKGYQMMRY
jgi:hypothetical protein